MFFAITQLAISQIAIDTVWSEEVKTVTLTRGGMELERPLIRLGGIGETQERLLLRFDILWPQPKEMRYRIRHCDAEWRVDNLEGAEYMSGPVEGDIENYQASFGTKRDYTNYYQSIPHPFSQFIASGNYVVEVYERENPDSMILTRRFCVYEDLTAIEIGVGKPGGAKGDILRDQEVSVGVTLREGSYLPLQGDYYRVEVQQNRREDLKRVMPFNGYIGSTLMYRWSDANVFPGGNTFRYFDISNLWAAMYHVQRIDEWGGEIFAFLQPEEDRSKGVYTQYSSLNGGMKINARDRRDSQIEADYVWVNFSLPMQKPLLTGSIHIVGDITDWNLGDVSRMEWNQKYRAYTKRMLLKQGYYSYQLIFKPAGEEEGLTSTIEGDHYAMPNSYAVFVYYLQPGRRYDRLVGVKER